MVFIAAPASAAPPVNAKRDTPPSRALAILFEAHSARVQPESGAPLSSLVAAMQPRELKGRCFLIEGHAEATGAAAQAFPSERHTHHAPAIGIGAYTRSDVSVLKGIVHDTVSARRMTA